jgi:hypothetical protein
VKADHDYQAQELELHHNTDVTESVQRLIQEIHQVVLAPQTTDGEPS